MRHFSYCTN